jgi:hypothetical protein
VRDERRPHLVLGHPVCIVVKAQAQRAIVLHYVAAHNTIRRRNFFCAVPQGCK